MAPGPFTRTIEIFTTRLSVLGALLGKAEAQWRDAGRDPASLVAARIADDMLPLPYQVAFACNQTNDFVAWGTGATAARPDPASLDYAGLKELVQAALGRLDGVEPKLDDGVLGRERRIDVSDEISIVMPGDRYVDDFLMPNFYFHLVTAYDILRQQGVAIGKADYMAYVGSYVRPRAAP